MKNRNCLLTVSLIVFRLAASRSLAQAVYEPYTFTTLAGEARSFGSEDGTASEARFGLVYDVAVDSAANVYVADWSNNTIRRVTPAGEVTTLAGLAGAKGSTDGTGSEARFDNQFGVAVDRAGNVYVADSYNFTIRKGFPTSIAAPILMPPSVIAGQFGFGIAGPPGRSVDIESSRDLSQWQPVGTVVLDGGTNYFVSATPPQGTEYYRAHLR